MQKHTYRLPRRDTMSEHVHDSHTGPIENPKQLWWTAFFAFVVPVALIMGLVFYATRDAKPQAGVVDPELATAQRIQKVGMVELRDANRPLAAGADVYKAQCAACHDAGLVGAPKIGDKAAWAPRITQGFETLVYSSLNGKGAMGAQGGGAFRDIEIARAVAYMANEAGANFPEPEAPADNDN